MDFAKNRVQRARKIASIRDLNCNVHPAMIMTLRYRAHSALQGITLPEYRLKPRGQLVHAAARHVWEE
jgi:hypothetical protein